MVEDILTSALGSTGTAYLIGGILLIWTASSLFLEMQRDLNDIFEVPLEEVAGIVAMVRRRGIGFLWVLGLGFLLVATWLINAIWGFVSSLLPGTLEVIDDLVTVLTPACLADPSPAGVRPDLQDDDGGERSPGGRPG